MHCPRSSAGAGDQGQQDFSLASRNRPSLNQPALAPQRPRASLPLRARHQLHGYGNQPGEVPAAAAASTKFLQARDIGVRDVLTPSDLPAPAAPPQFDRLSAPFMAEIARITAPLYAQIDDITAPLHKQIAEVKEAHRQKIASVLGAAAAKLRAEIGSAFIDTPQQLWISALHEIADMTGIGDIDIDLGGVP
jgi:hypothetical protein